MSSHRPTTAHAAGNAAGGRLVRVRNRPRVERLTVAANERRQQLHRKASPLQLQDIHARFGVGLDIRDPADLAARKKPRVDPAPGDEQLPGLLADSEAAADASSFHAAGLPQPPKGPLRRFAFARLRRIHGRRERGLQMHVARHPALSEEDELLDHVDHDLHGDSPDGPDLAHLRGAHRSRQNDGVSAQVPEKRDVRDGLGAATDAGRQAQVPEALLERRQDSDVVHDDVSNPEIQEGGDALEKSRALRGLRDRVQGDVKVPAGGGDRALRGGQLVPVELPPRAAAAPALEAHVDGVRPRAERGPDGLGTSGWSEEHRHGHHLVQITTCCRLFIVSSDDCRLRFRPAVKVFLDAGRSL